MTGLRVVLGVSGGIAAYKVAGLLRTFTEAGHDVTVVPTVAALRFVGEATWAALSGKPVATDVWTDADQVPHVRIGQQADLVVVAPATADLLARAAHGLADDLLTSTLLTARCPVVYAPAMHTEMWEHPATQANVALLRERGAEVVPPASGRLTGTDTGPGRLPEPAELYAACLAAVSTAAGSPVGVRDLAGRHVVVTAGGTREPLDPVRYLGNRSSGKQGYALAATAVRRGAEVTLISATTSVAPPDGVRLVRVGTALDLREAVHAIAASADVVVMAAAVADFRPRHYESRKIKKTHPGPVVAGPVGARTSDDPTGDGDAADENAEAPVLALVRNPDILAELVAARAGSGRPLLVGFAAETGDETGTVLDLARQKLARKGCDILVANEVGTDKVFGRDDNTVHVLFRDGRPDRPVGPASKDVIAAAVWDAVADLLPPLERP